MSLADGFGWLQCRSDHARRFGVQVPDWISCYDLPQRIRLGTARAGPDPGRIPLRTLERVGLTE